MHDIRVIRENPDRFVTKLRDRGVEIDVAALLERDTRRRQLIREGETLQAERNSASKEIGKLKKAGEDASAAMEKVREMGNRVSEIEAEKSEVIAALDAELMNLPNLAHDSVPVGADERANPVLRTWGEVPAMNFEAQAHWDLADKLGIFEFERAAALSGAGFSCLTGQGARLSRALVQFMLDLHTTEHGYREIQPPLLVNSDALEGTGQLPKFADELYRVPEDGLWLIPTAEVPVTNLYRNSIIDEELPLSLTAQTPCFRREAGAAGKMTRGMNRLHQFDKVELVCFSKPEESFARLETLTGHAETVLQKLGLHYRVIELCTGDLGFSAAKTYDIELWAPGQDGWLEVSSCSCFEAFQARRAKIRYRDEDRKPALVHTLNGSGVAVPRLFVAILEQGQQEDGSVVLPEAIRPYMGGLERLTPPGATAAPEPTS